MCSPFSCGSFKNLKSYDIDDDEFPLSRPCTTPRRAKSYRSYSTKRRKDGNNNPYANQGLDKFSALVAELEEKKQKIYTQKGSEEISFIYFTYKKSDDLRPIIVKAKKQQQQQHQIITTTDQNAKVGASYSEAQDKHKKIKIDASSADGRVDQKVRQPKRELNVSQRFKTFVSLKLKNPRFVFSYFPVTIVLILLALTIRGRSFAILCTTVAWYLVPIIYKVIQNSSSSKGPMKKSQQ